MLQHQFSTNRRMPQVAWVLALLLAVLPACSLASAATTATVATGPIDVYATAHLGSPVITQLAAGTRVQVTSFDDNWAEIIVTGGELGYVVASYLSFGAPVPTAPPVYPSAPPIINPTIMATVQSGPLNVHTAAGLSAPIITQLPTGSVVQVISYDANWATIVLANGEVGYVATGYLSLGGHHPNPAPTAVAEHERVVTSDANATVATTNHGPLHLRNQPSFDAGIINTYANGSRVMVMSQNGTWYYVKAGNTVGYMDAEFIVLDAGAQLNETGAGYDAVVQNATDGEILHLRKEPSIDSESLGEYHNGTYVEVLAVGAEWNRVIVEGKTGYMKSEFVHIISPDATAGMLVDGGQTTEVNLYRGPALSDEIVTGMPNGSPVTVLVPEEEWSMVQYLVDGIMETGYVQNEYLTPNTTQVDTQPVQGNG